MLLSHHLLPVLTPQTHWCSRRFHLPYIPRSDKFLFCPVLSFWFSLIASLSGRETVKTELVQNLWPKYPIKNAQLNKGTYIRTLLLLLLQLSKMRYVVSCLTAHMWPDMNFYLSILWTPIRTLIYGWRLWSASNLSIFLSGFLRQFSGIFPL